MSRKTELATIYRELVALEARMLLVGAYAAARLIGQAISRTAHFYWKEVEKIAQEAAGRS